MLYKNIFLDRDGTIIVDKNYLANPDEVELLPNSGIALQALQAAGCNLFVVTNQSGIGRAMLTENDYFACSRALDKQLHDFGVKLKDSLHCPHLPEEGCACRKPQIAMWNNLKKRHQLDASLSVMIGDKEADILFGKNASFAQNILVLTGKGTQSAQKMALPILNPYQNFLALPKSPNQPDCIAKDLNAAVEYLLEAK